MNKTILCILLAVFIVSFGAREAKALGPNDTVLSYFQVLQQGDINRIKDYITGEMYNKINVLLEQNDYYPEYLKKAYQGSEFQIKEAIIQKNDAVITVEVKSPDRKTQFILFLKKDDSGTWKIFKEINCC